MMKQGKGVFLRGDNCAECSQRIGPGTADSPAYWAWEPYNYTDYRGWNSDRRYYHRVCARRMQKRREAERVRQHERGA